MVDASRRRLLFGKMGQDDQPAAIRLPWVISESVFVDVCTRCGDCVSVCPSNIIQRGGGGFPELNFQHDGCSFCGECVAACRQPLFSMPIDNTSSGNASSGHCHNQNNAWDYVAEIDHQCLTAQGIFCQNCKDACEARAIVFKYGQQGIPKPVISKHDCTGCGACISPCPADSIRLHHHDNKNQTDQHRGYS